MRRKRYVATLLCLAALVAGAFVSPAQANLFNLKNRAPIPTEISRKMDALEEEKGDIFEKWSLEDKAATEDLEWAQNQGIVVPDDYEHTLPGEGELPQAEATELARQTLLQRYILSREELDAFEIRTSFVRDRESGETYWLFTFFPSSEVGAKGIYTLKIAARTGEIITAHWSQYDFWSYAAALYEQGKIDAIEDHIHDEGFGALPLKDKAMYSAMFEEAGRSPFQKGYYHIMPTEGAVPEEEAIEIATQAVKDAYGFTDRVLANNVEIQTSFMKTPEGAQLWVVDFLPQPYRDRYGTYRVEITADTGVVASIAWTFDGIDEAELSTDSLAGPVLGAAQLDRLEGLWEAYYARQEDMEAQLGPYESWTLEEKAELDHVWKENGNPKEDMVYSDLPGEGEISEADALQKAKDEILAKFDITKEALDAFNVYMTFHRMPYGKEALWSFHFVPETEDPALGEYRVEFTAESGVVEFCNWYVERSAP